MDWETFLRWLSNPTAIPVVVGIVLSVIAKYVPQFERLRPKWKRATFFCASVGVPLLGATLGVLTVGWPASFTKTFWPAIVSGVLAFGAGTMNHLRQMSGPKQGGTTS